MADPRHLLTLDQASRTTGLAPSTLIDLAAAGHLPVAVEDPRHDRPEGCTARFAHSDLRGLLARLGGGFVDSPHEVEASFAALDPQVLLDELGRRCGEMAERAMDLLATVVPEAATWSATRRAAVVAEAKARFEVLVALATVGPAVDQDTIDELAALGRTDDWGDRCLVESLLTLRLSRDLLVQSSVELAERHGRQWGLALSVVLARVLPTVDRLTDAVVDGHWKAVLDRQAEGQARYANVVEGSSDGVYEADLTGRLRYVNASFAVIVGRPEGALVGRRLDEVLGPEVATIGEGGHVEVRVERPDGVERVLDVRAVARRRPDGTVAGHDGVVRDRTARVRYEVLRRDLLALVRDGLRTPAGAALRAVGTLEAACTSAHQRDGGLAPGEVARHLQEVRREVERIVRRAEALTDLGAVADGSFSVFRAPIDVAAVVARGVRSALGWNARHADAVTITTRPGLAVLADAARVEQVVANLVDNALRYGDGPVEVEVVAAGDPTGGPDGPARVVVEVRDRGPGVDQAEVDGCFARLRDPGEGAGSAARRSGTLGLAVVRGLVEAMGGTVWYRPRSGGGACFGFSVPPVPLAGSGAAEPRRAS